MHNPKFVPDGGPRSREAAAAHWARLREAGMAAGLWFLYGVYRLGGRGLYRVLLAPVSVYFALTRGVARRASIDYLQRVGALSPQASAWARWRAVVRHIACFADVLLDKALTWSGALDLRGARLAVDPRFEAQVKAAAAAAGRGGVLVVAHCGNLEAMRALGKRLPQLRMRILVHTLHAERFNRLLQKLNPESHANLMQVTEVDAAAAVELAACVERGEFIVIAADRIPVRGIERTVEVPFLGAPARFPIGPWVLAAVLGCPVYWLSCVKEGEIYALDCEQLAERVTLPRAQRDAALADIARRYAARLEALCRRAPYQWFNFYPFWTASQ
jgi:predicted LPLAT superfamily acyltransferase